MRVEPLLILVSGEQRSPGPLAFTATAKGLHFTSCSGLLLLPETSHAGVVLLPASVLRPWLQPGSSWLTSASIDPPHLVRDCAICAVGPASSLSGGAAVCTPVCTVQVPAIARAATQILRSLNRDAFASNWAYEWHVGGGSCTAADQGAFVLCWAQLLHGGLGASSAASTASASSAALPLPSPPPHPADVPAHHGRTTSTADGVIPSRAASGPSGYFNVYDSAVAGVAPVAWLPDPQCVAVLQSLRAALAESLRPAACAAAANTVAGDGAGICDAMSMAPLQCTAAAGRSLRPGLGAAPGSLVSVVGSPFGCLAPFHFANAHVNGAVAAAFPAPLIAANPAASAGAASALWPPLAAVAAAADCCGCGLGPALYVLDAHVFPGMEGALVAPLRPPAACYGGGGSGDRQAPPGGGASACGGSCGAHAWRQTLEPLAVLCTPVSRRADGVQLPLAAAWLHVAAAAAGALGQLLLRVLEPGGPNSCEGGSGAGGAAAAGGEQAGPQQQLQLQPVAASLLPAAAAGSGGCVDGGCKAAVARLEPRPAALLRPCAAAAGCSSTTAALEGSATPYGGWGWGTGSPRMDCCCCGGGGGGGGPPQAPSCTKQLCSCAGGCSGGGGCSGKGPLRVAADGGPAAAEGGAAEMQRCDDDAAAAAASASPCAGLAAASSGVGGVSGPPQWALQAVVLLRCNGSWATGVVVESRSGLLITTAHLVQRQPAASAGGVAAARPGKHISNAWAHVQVWARVPSPAGDGCGAPPACGVCGSTARRAPAYCWLRARVLYVWSNHLDLAVLQLGPWYGSRGAPAAPAAVREMARARDETAREAFVIRRPPAAGLTAPATDTYGTYGAGSPVWAVGHSLVGPAAEWPALVSYGCVARVLRGRSGRPSLLVVSPTTHAGGSGGALLDSCGRLVGLVTSNARHAGRATLPNLAFCIAAEELEPLMRWASGAAEALMVAAGRVEGGAAAAAFGTAPGDLLLSALEALDREDEDCARIWRLQMPFLDHAATPAGCGGGGAAVSAAAVAATSTSPSPDPASAACMQREQPTPSEPPSGIVSRL